MRIFKLIAVLLVCFATAHLVITLLYVLPGNLVPVNAKKKSAVYMFPLFDQSWGLFAPVPEVNKRLYYCLEDSNGNQQSWRQFYAGHLFDYQSNRFSPRGKFVLALSNTLHYLYQENKENLIKQNLYGGSPSSGYFTVLQHLVKQELKNNSTKTKKVRMMVVYQTITPNPQTYCLYYPAFDVY